MTFIDFVESTVAGAIATHPHLWAFVTGLCKWIYIHVICVVIRVVTLRRFWDWVWSFLWKW
jgi:hypothetical protein